MRGEGLTMTFGVPPRPQPGASPEVGNHPPVLVLMALLNQGGFAQWMPIGVSTSREELESYLGIWLRTNHQSYGGQFRLQPVPFVIPPGVKL